MKRPLLKFSFNLLLNCLIVRKIILFVILSVILLPSCSREEDRKHNEKQKQQFYMQSTYDQKLKKELFYLQLETAESLLKETDQIKPQDVYGFSRVVYKSTEFNYAVYLERQEMDYQEYNKNGNYLIFPLNNKNYIEDNNHVDIFKYKN